MSPRVLLQPCTLSLSVQNTVDWQVQTDSSSALYDQLLQACSSMMHLFNFSRVMVFMLGVVLEMKRQIALSVSINQQYTEAKLGKNVGQQIAEGSLANTSFEGEEGNNQSLGRYESSCSVSKCTQCICTAA